MYLFLWMEVRYEAARDLHFVRMLETPECSPVRSMCDRDTLLRVIIDDAGLRLPAMNALNIPLGVDAACQTVGLPKVPRPHLCRESRKRNEGSSVHLPPTTTTFSILLHLTPTHNLHQPPTRLRWEGCLDEPAISLGLFKSAPERTSFNSHFHRIHFFTSP
jgi:hypothetical protein